MSKSNAIGTTLTVNSKTVGGLTSINGIEINADGASWVSLKGAAAQAAEEEIAQVAEAVAEPASCRAVKSRPSAMA